MKTLASSALWTDDQNKVQILDSLKLQLRQALIFSSGLDDTLQELIEEATRIDDSLYAVQAKYRTGEGAPALRDTTAGNLPWKEDTRPRIADRSKDLAELSAQR